MNATKEARLREIIREEIAADRLARSTIFEFDRDAAVTIARRDFKALGPVLDQALIDIGLTQPNCLEQEVRRA